MLKRLTPMLLTFGALLGTAAAGPALTRELKPMIEDQLGPAVTDRAAVIDAAVEGEPRPTRADRPRKRDCRDGEKPAWDDAGRDDQRKRDRRRGKGKRRGKRGGPRA